MYKLCSNQQELTYHFTKRRDNNSLINILSKLTSLKIESCQHINVVMYQFDRYSSGTYLEVTRD